MEIDMPGLQARQLYDRTRLERDLAEARQKARRSQAAGIGAPVVRYRAIDRTSKLYQTALDFEAIFIKQMLTTMRRTVDKAGLINGGMAEEIFEDMLYDQYASKMARTARFGLADQITLQLTREGASGK